MRKTTKFLRFSALAAGTLLLLASAVIVLSGMIRQSRAVSENAKTLEFLEAYLPKKTAGFKEERYLAEMPSRCYEGTDYDGIFGYPRFGVKLPVGALWDKKDAEVFPCRYFGNASDGTLVIGGTDGKGQFDFVSSADIGDEVTFTDLRGAEYVYTVKEVRHSKKANAGNLTNSGFDLTLFAKDKKSGDYLIIRCNLS